MTNLAHLAFDRRFKAVFFDLDGTLFDSEPLHADALVRSAKDCDINLEGIDPIHDFLGMPDPAVYRYLDSLGRVPSTTTQEQFIAAKNAYYLAICRDLTKDQWQEITTPGLRELLFELKKQNLLTAVVSASEPVVVEAMLRGADIIQFFDHITARGICFRSKPSPGPYLHTLRHWRLHSNNVLVFEDSPTGKKSAKLSGCHTIAVANFTKQEDSDLPIIDNYFGLNQRILDQGF